MQLTEDYTDFSLKLMAQVILSFVQKIDQMLETCMWGCEKLSTVTYTFIS